MARKTRSHALAADALHFASDLLASTLVLIGLAANNFGFTQGDALAAAGVALFIGVAGVKLGRATLDNLLDTAPEGLAEKLRAGILRTPGVVAVEDIKLRPNGPHVLGEITIAVARSLPIDRVAGIEAAVRARVAEISPETQATVTASPRALDDETMTERIMLIAARKKLAVHHIIVHHLGDKDCIAFDLEIDGGFPHGKAHEIATELEDDIRAEIGSEIEVESHIEPLQAHALTGHDADAATLTTVSAALRRVALQGGIVHDIHDVRARQTEDGIVVNFHATVDPSLSVAETHAAMDAVERALRDQTPGLLRIIGHAEPLRAL